jgi:hypothetical protein
MRLDQDVASDLVATVSPIFATAGSAWYFTEETVAIGRQIGLDGARFYFVGRGSVLGDVEWRVVHSAFGYFSPRTLERMWTTGVERCPVAEACAAHLSACEDWGRRRLSDSSGLDRFCAAAERVVEAAAADPAALTLFAGYAAQALPEDLAARAARFTATLRELRGSVHLAAVVAVGLPTPVAHAIRRPTDMETFGWKPGSVPEPTAEDRDRLSEADRLTDRAMSRIYAVLDDAAASDLRSGALAIAGCLGA